jgi:hypothetical protein
VMDGVRRKPRPVTLTGDGVAGLSVGGGVLPALSPGTEECKAPSLVMAGVRRKPSPAGLGSGLGAPSFAMTAAGLGSVPDDPNAFEGPEMERIRGLLMLDVADESSDWRGRIIEPRSGPDDDGSAAEPGSECDGRPAPTGRSDVARCIRLAPSFGERAGGVASAAEDLLEGDDAGVGIAGTFERTTIALGGVCTGRLMRVTPMGNTLRPALLSESDDESSSESDRPDVGDEEEPESFSSSSTALSGGCFFSTGSGCLTSRAANFKVEGGDGGEG